MRDQYELLEKIGEGSFGAVHKARDIHLQQIVAIKELLLDAPSMLREEAQVLSELRHDNIVGFRQLFPEGKHWYMVMDYVDGGSLAHWIRTKSIYGGGQVRSLPRIVAVATHVAEGLNYAHSKGVVHQDVKPGNVMITVGGIARVSDFGLAKGCPAAQNAVGSEGDRSILVSVGGMTPAFCSPEQHRRQKLTDRTDVWSWGLSVLQMFTGDVTWKHGTAAREAFNEYVAAGAADPALPLPPLTLVDLLRRCFNEAQDQRPSMGELVRALKQIDLKELHHPQLIRVSIAKSPEEKACVVKAILAGERFARIGNGTLIDTKANLMWAAEPNGEDISRKEAGKLVDTCRTGGHADWRLPSVEELEAILGVESAAFPWKFTISRFAAVDGSVRVWAAKKGYGLLGTRGFYLELDRNNPKNSKIRNLYVDSTSCRVLPIRSAR